MQFTLPIDEAIIGRIIEGVGLIDQVKRLEQDRGRRIVDGCDRDQPRTGCDACNCGWIAGACEQHGAGVVFHFEKQPEMRIAHGDKHCQRCHQRDDRQGQ